MRNNGRCFDFHLGAVFHQSDDLHEGHRGEMLADDLAVDAAQLLETSQIFALVGHIPREAHDVLRSGVCLCENGHNVPQRLRHLTSRATLAQFVAAKKGS